MKKTGGHDLIVFDGDDTLWRTQEIYDAIKARFVDIVASEGLDPSDALSTLNRIDADAAQVQGFTVRRFLESMNRTYQLLAAKNGRESRPESQGRIAELIAPLGGEYQLYPDALDVLARLKPRFDLVLATKGEPDLQRQKIRRLKLSGFFNQVYVLERKTELEYRRILDECGTTADRAWAVGNSVRSDINPALLIGMNAIWIRRPTWLYEDADLSNEDAPAVNSLSEAAEVLLSNQRRMVTARN